MRSFLSVFALVAILLSGCSLFEYHPYEVRVPNSEKNTNAKAFKSIQDNESTSDTIRFILMGDTQRFYDDVEDFVERANQEDFDFVLLDGDISDFGINDEFAWVHDIMKHLKKPYMAVIGNHDLSGNGEKVYEQRYGPLNDAFITKRFKFILLNTNSREYKFNGHVPDIAYLQQQLIGDDFDRAIVVSHIPPYADDFDPQLEQAYATALSGSGKVNLSLHGHTHNFANTIHYDDGVRYLISTSMDKRMFLHLTVVGDQYTIREIYF